MIPYGPVRSWLAEYEPFLLRDRPKLFAQELPAGVTREQAVEVVAGSEWAQHLAQGMCGKLVGMAPGTSEYESCVRRVSHKVAEGVLT